MGPPEGAKGSHIDSTEEEEAGLKRILVRSPRLRFDPDSHTGDDYPDTEPPDSDSMHDNCLPILYPRLRSSCLPLA